MSAITARRRPLAIVNPDEMPARQVRLGFADIDGRAIVNPDVSDLRPGEGTIVDLEAAAMGDPDLREGGRAELRPVALGGPDTRCCRLAFTAQIFGLGGNRTEVLMSAPPEPE